MIRGAGASEHYAWQTRGPFVAARERELVERAFLPISGRVLDVGCGHGATLLHLGAPPGAVGVDVEADKIEFAKAELPGCSFAVASALALPFPDASFDQVIIRDVVHHIPDPRGAIDECRRVLRPGGRIDVLEPCRNNPLVFFHGLLLEEERGELRSTPEYLRSLLSRAFDVTETHRYQAMPIHRLVFHPELGWPAAPRRTLPRLVVAGLERAAERLIPEWAWAYVHVRAFRPQG